MVSLRRRLPPRAPAFPLGGLAAAMLLALPAAPAFAQPAPPPPPAARAGAVDILEYVVEGNTVLSNVEIEKAVYPFLGPGRDTGDVEKARAALEQAYRAKGYETVGVEIPEQQVQGGVVRLNVTQLTVGRLRVTGSRYYSPEDIKEQVPSLAEGRVPRYTEVSRDIEEVNKSRDRTITPTLRAGATPGTVDVDLQVQDQLPVHGSVELNDRYSGNTSRARLVASLSYSNLFQRDHSFSLQFQTAPSEASQSKVLSGSYVAPLRGTDWTLVAYGVHSDSNVAAVGGINVLGKGDIAGLRGIYSLPGGEGFTHRVSAGVDYKNFKENLVLGPASALTPIKYAPFVLEYSLNTAGERHTTEATASLNFALRGLGDGDEAFRLKRFNAKANYFYVKGDWRHTRDFEGGFRLKGAAGAQLAGEPLISNEQFSAGGYDSVRGYVESQQIGDSGLRLSLQAESPGLQKYLGEAVKEWRVYAFAEGAALWTKDPLPDANGRLVHRASLASVGIGTRINVNDKFNADFVLAVPRKDQDGKYLDAGRVRAHLRVWSEF